MCDKQDMCTGALTDNAMGGQKADEQLLWTVQWIFQTYIYIYLCYFFFGCATLFGCIRAKQLKHCAESNIPKAHSTINTVRIALCYKHYTFSTVL